MTVLARCTARLDVGNFTTRVIARDAEGKTFHRDVLPDEGQSFRDAAADLLLTYEGYRVVGGWVREYEGQPGEMGVWVANTVAHPDRCPICVAGCDHQTGEPGCEHRGCWGTVPPDKHTSCPGANLT